MMEAILADPTLSQHKQGETQTIANDGYIGIPVEITTYRVDGTYADHRRPDTVTFTSSLGEDLARRDFTVNAMAYHPEYGIVDLYSGRRDLADGIIRAVGEPMARFSEDALRILRALRFSARFGFRIDRKSVV